MDREDLLTYCPLARAECINGELKGRLCAFYDYEGNYCHITNTLESLSSLGEVCNTDLGYLNISGGIDTYEQN